MSTNPVPTYQNLTVQQVKQKQDRGDTFRLIDVREPQEHAIAQIEGAELLPLSQAQQWIGTLQQDEELVILCHSGFRSQQVANYLVNQGFEKVANVLGGIDAWSLEVDPQVPRY